jgi:hypothetical protein
VQLRIAKVTIYFNLMKDLLVTQAFAQVENILLPL